MVRVHVSLFAMLLSLAALPSCGDSLDGSGGWSVLGDALFSGHADNRYAIAAADGQIWVGYWDTELERPAVQHIPTGGGDWTYACGGPVPLDGLTFDDLSYTTFQFRQDGGRSVVGFNARMIEGQLVLFACDGGEWERLPDVPLGEIPGFAGEQRTSNLTEQDFAFDARGGEIYAVVNSQENAWPDEKTCLSLFQHDGAAWTLAPERRCYPNVGFSYEAAHSEVVVRAGTAGVYVGTYLWEDATNETSARVLRFDGAGWSDLTDAAFFPSSSGTTTEFGLRVFDDGGSDGLLVNLGGADYLTHVKVYRGGAWSELPGTGAWGSAGSRSSAVVARWDDGVYLAFEDPEIGLGGLSVKHLSGGGWEYVGEAAFTDTAYEFYDDVLATDGQSLFLVYQSSIMQGGEDTRGRLTVARHDL